MVQDHSYILVTGANSGLGLGICCRLIDDFFATQSASAQLTILFSTRTSRKSSDTLRLLETRVSKHGGHVSGSDRVHFRPVSVDLTDLLSVKALAKQLNASDIPKLNAVVLNAGMIGLVGLNWPLALWSVVSDIVHAFTWPTYKISAVGLVTKRQLEGSGAKKIEEPPLGEIFCANVFGHYMLSHWLMPLLRACPSESPGKVIWISSIECKASHYNPDDLQGLISPRAYEHSKRLTDLMALTARDQPATAKSVKDFTTASHDLSQSVYRPDSSVPTIHAVQPGICVTSIVPLYWIMLQMFTAVAYVSRWVGSPWSTVSPYSGAFSVTWLAFASPDEIKAKEASGSAKWGSAVFRSGRNRAEKTEVEGWGLNGSGESYQETWWGRDMFGSWGRIRGATEATKEDVEKFLDVGARVWREIEELRVQWEDRIADYEKA